MRLRKLSLTFVFVGCANAEMDSDMGMYELENAKWDIPTDLTEVTELSWREQCELQMYSEDLFEDEYERVWHCAGFDLGPVVGNIEQATAGWGGQVYSVQHRQYGDIYLAQGGLEAVGLWGAIRDRVARDNLIPIWGIPTQHETPWPGSGGLGGVYVKFANGPMLTYSNAHGVIAIESPLLEKVGGPTGTPMQTLGIPTSAMENLPGNVGKRQTFHYDGGLVARGSYLSGYQPTTYMAANFAQWRNRAYATGGAMWDVRAPLRDSYRWQNPITGVTHLREDLENGVMLDGQFVFPLMRAVWNANQCLGKPTAPPVFVDQFWIWEVDYWSQQFTHGQAFVDGSGRPLWGGASCNPANIANPTTAAAPYRTCSGRAASSITAFRVDVLEDPGCVNQLIVYAENALEAEQCGVSLGGPNARASVTSTPLSERRVRLTTQQGTCHNRTVFSNSDENAIACVENTSGYMNPVGAIGTCD